MNVSARRLAVLGCAFALSCDQCETLVLTRGNLDRVADIVVVTRDGQSFAFTANPEIEALRVADLSEGVFVAAPNRYSPLSIPMGPDTRALAVASGADGVDAARVYALDGADDTVRVVDTTRFVVVATIATGRAPRDIAAIDVGDTHLLAVVYADHVDLIPVDKDVAGDATAVDFGAGAAGVAIAADPAGSAFVVADAALAVAHVVDVDGAVVDVDVSGPQSGVAVGVVDTGAGDTPVAVLLRTDTPALMAVGLAPAPTLLGGAGLPRLPLVAYVPDSRAVGAAADLEPTLCCGGLSTAAEDAGESTLAFATVWLSDGDVVHVALAAARKDGEDLGRPLVRLVDDDVLALAPTVDVNTAVEVWQPPVGGEAFRPTLSFAAVDNFGTPPFVPAVRGGAVVTLTWEGDLTRAQNLAGVDYNSGTRTFTTNRDLVARGARVGDVARFVQLAPEDPALCAQPLRGVISAVVGSDVTVDAGAEFDVDVADVCLGRGPDTVRLTIEVQGAFVVEEDGVFRGRLVDADAGGADADATISFPGAALSVSLSSAGAPVPGSVLAFALDPHVDTMGLNLADDVSFVGDGGVGTAAFVATGIAGGATIIPDPTSDDRSVKVKARRMALSSGSIDGTSGLPLLITCDEAETSLGLVETFR
jgi:YVTN family beta-propeller protein